jgi:hypothetical protein
MTPEALIVHRQLQYLRAEASGKPRRRLSKTELRRRRAYARLRHEKLEAAKRLTSKRLGWPH